LKGSQGDPTALAQEGHFGTILDHAREHHRAFSNRSGSSTTIRFTNCTRGTC
jgi:hypothetical protein